MPNLAVFHSIVLYSSKAYPLSGVPYRVRVVCCSVHKNYRGNTGCFRNLERSGDNKRG